MKATSINLNSLSRGYRPGLSSSLGGVMAECASVCLYNNSHDNGANIIVYGDYNGSQIINGIEISDQILRSHADDQVATEYGAYGISILLIEEYIGITMIERSRKGGGFDIWLGISENKNPYFQKLTRLEVSGILKGDKSKIETRVNQKKKQISRSSGDGGALVSIVEFSAPCSKVVRG